MYSYIVFEYISPTRKKVNKSLIADIYKLLFQVQPSGFMVLVQSEQDFRSIHRKYLKQSSLRVQLAPKCVLKDKENSALAHMLQII